MNIWPYSSVVVIRAAKNYREKALQVSLKYDLIINTANGITLDDCKLENKIVLSIAIRLCAELFMKSEISKLSISYKLKWTKKIDGKDTEITGNKDEFFEYIESSTYQTRLLFKVYIQIGRKENIEVLDHVNIMTPENIHLNSFMYEPILDMDICELKGLYDDVKNLN